MTHVAVAAIFNKFNPATSRFDEVTVPLVEVAAYHASNPSEWVQKVVWQDGTWSWGKSWVFGSTLRDGSDNPRRGQICRIGAGAYGDVKVWEAGA